MPQIFPMNWIMISIIMMVMVVIFMTHLYFISFNNLNTLNMKKKNQMILLMFKW